MANLPPVPDQSFFSGTFLSTAGDFSTAGLSTASSALAERFPFAGTPPSESAVIAKR